MVAMSGATAPATAASGPSTSSAAASKGAQIDAKREEFRKYLEKEGILETLTKSLVILFAILVI